MDLLQKVVFIDGITRSGKSMVAPLFRSSESFDPLIFSYDLEYVMAGLAANQLSLDFARSFFLKVINERVYDAALGRNFNFRDGEISSLSKVLHAKALQERLLRGDGDGVLKTLGDQMVITPFFTHDMAVSYSQLLKLSLDIHLIEVLRDPFEITYSWVTKRWGERQLSDPRSFKHVLEVNGSLVPWQARQYSDDWLASTPEDRCGLVVADSNNKLLFELKSNVNAKLLCVDYESFATNTQTESERIARFLSVDPKTFKVDYLKSENLPRTIDFEAKNEKVQTLKAMLSPKVFEMLLKAQEGFLAYREHLVDLNSVVR